MRRLSLRRRLPLRRLRVRLARLRRLWLWWLWLLLAMGSLPHLLSSARLADKSELSWPA